MLEKLAAQVRVASNVWHKTIDGVKGHCRFIDSRQKRAKMDKQSTRA